MRVKIALLHRFPARALALAALLSATLSGCAAWHSVSEHAAPKDVAATSDANPNAGAQTTQVTELQHFLWVFSPYRPDIQQGNFVSQEMLNQLKVGQSREQVKFILGTPLLADIFHNDRWDYPFYLARGNGELTTSRVTVYFKDNKVEHFDGGNLPTEREYIARIAGAPVKEVAGPPKKEDPGSASVQIKK